MDNNCCCINKDYEFKSDISDIMKFKSSGEDSIKSLLSLKHLFRGDLLEGCYFKNCDELNDFIIFERMKFEQHNVRILKRLVELYENVKNYEECLEVISEIHEIEPYDEEMALKTLDIFVESEKPVDAITYYNNFSEILVNSLGVFPSHKLRNKYEEIRSTLSESYGNSQIEEDEYISPGNSLAENTLKITSDCIKNIEYFWIADVVGKIINTKKSDCINKLDIRELVDLGHIQSNILKYCDEKAVQIYEREVLGVNIVNAFIKLLKCICERYRLMIIILNSSDMDDISVNVLNYLRRVNIQGLSLIEK